MAMELIAPALLLEPDIPFMINRPTTVKSAIMTKNSVIDCPRWPTI